MLPLQFAATLTVVLAVLGSAAAQNDVDILNFALNLECLEAAFYSCAAYGLNLTTAYLGRLSALNPAAFHKLSPPKKRRLLHTSARPLSNCHLLFSQALNLNEAT